MKHVYQRSALSILAIAGIGFVCLAPATYAAPIMYTFQTINNPADPTFNQLLGINNAGTISGYFGSGSATHPNQGYVVTPPYSAGSFISENFPGSAQTQVVGLNNGTPPTTVGFWADAAGNNFGFTNQGNTVFTSVQDPNTPTTGTLVNQLLGVNTSGMAAGFYVDANGNSQGYVYNIPTQQFTAVTLPTAFNAASTTATGINNGGAISGFYVDTNGNTHGFIDNGGTFTSYDDPNGTNTMIFGLNNNGQAVGSFTDAAGVNNGFMFDYLTNTWQTVNDPLSSTTAAFDITGTILNGINDRGQLVGFYSDGTNIDGMLATPTPEPASLGLVFLGTALAGLGWKKRRAL